MLFDGFFKTAITPWVIATTLVLSLLMAIVPSRAYSQWTREDSLYRRLGGKKGIQMVVYDFIAKIAEDSRINMFFVEAAKDPKKLRAYKAKLVDQICQASGGSCKYLGKDMRAAHQDLGMTDNDFEVVINHLAAALEKNGIGEMDRNQILGALGVGKAK